MYFIVTVAIGIMTAIGCSKNNPVPTMEVNSLSFDECNCGIITKVVNVHTYYYPDTSYIESTMMVRNECSGVVEKFIIEGDYKGKESGYICFDEAW